MKLKKKDSINEYLKYLDEHIETVNTCFRILRGGNIDLNHDLSKFEPVEFYPYLRHFYPYDDMETDKFSEDEYEQAWLHHIHHNEHHWNYWVLVDSDGVVPLEMPQSYVYEMIADWASFAFRSKKPDELQKWYDKNKDKMKLHSNTRKEVERLVPEMVEKLEFYFKREGLK